MTPRAIVLDANVLMRGVLGRKVDRLLDQFAPNMTFLAPDVAFDDVREHLAAVLTKRDELHALQACLDKLEALQRLVRVVDESEYLSMKPAALERIGRLDPDDWPILACALQLSAPSGPRTATSSAPASPPGRLLWSKSISPSPNRERRSTDLRADASSPTDPKFIAHTVPGNRQCGVCANIPEKLQAHWV